ncbi:MAG: DNA primase, partial [Alcaligenaceae bacterium]
VTSPPLGSLPAVGQGIVGAKGRGRADSVGGATAPSASSTAPGEPGAPNEQDYQEPPGFMPSAGRGRAASRTAPGRVDRRAVAPMAKRLLRLLLTHPELVDVMGEQQLEILERGPHLEMVRELIVLAQATGARHVGALIQASDPGADLGVLMASVAEDLMSQEPLPNPQGEWEDALRRIELESLKNEQQVLISEGLNNLQSQQIYRELSSRITRLIGVIETSKAR